MGGVGINYMSFSIDTFVFDLLLDFPDFLLSLSSASSFGVLVIKLDSKVVNMTFSDYTDYYTYYFKFYKTITVWHSALISLTGNSC